MPFVQQNGFQERESEKAKVDLEIAAKRKVDKEKKVSEPAKDTRSKAQKDRQEREELKDPSRQDPSRQEQESNGFTNSF